MVDLKTLSVAELEKRLSSSPDGLTAAEASIRLAKDGPNESSGSRSTGATRSSGRSN
jgi:hypothetical protein